jgi:hypothetical protein
MPLKPLKVDTELELATGEQLRDRARRDYALRGQPPGLTPSQELTSSAPTNDVEQSSEVQRLKSYIFKQQGSLETLKAAAKEVARAWYEDDGARLRAVGIDPQALAVLMEWGEGALLEEYVASLNGEGPPVAAARPNAAADSTLARSLVAIAAAQEGRRQGLEYIGCDVRYSANTTSVVAHFKARPGNTLDCVALRRAISRFVNADMKLQITADVHTEVPVYDG